MKTNTLIKLLMLPSTLLLISACSRTAQFTPPFTQPAPLIESPIAIPIAPVNRTVPVVEFLDSQAFDQLSEQDKTMAANAQFNALQFGRPGAPRNWAGANSVSGKIIVGPFISEGGVDCRSFEHSVTIDQVTYDRVGTACRGPENSWSVRG